MASLSTMSLPFLGVIALTLFIVTSYVRSYLRLRHIPGPLLAGWTRFSYVHNAISGELGPRHLALCKKYGSLVRIAPNILMTSDEDFIRELNAVRGIFPRTDFYRGFRLDADNDNLVSTIDDKKHDLLRSKMFGGYGGLDNPQLESQMDTVIWSLINLIKSKYISRGSDLKKMDWANISQYFSLDIITAIGMGRQFGWLTDDEDKFLFVKTWTANLPIVALLTSLPPIAWLMTHPKIQPHLVPSVRERAGLGAVKGAAIQEIKKRFGPDKITRQDMTQSFIKRGLTLTQLADEAVIQIIGGSDTTATVLRTLMQCILHNPRVYFTLQREIDTAAKTIPSDRIISHAEAQKLPYLSACISEALRIRPPGAGLLPRLVPPQGYMHKGTFIPGGTEVGVCYMAVCMNPLVFGSDVETYRPERWIEAAAAATGETSSTPSSHVDFEGIDTKGEKKKGSSGSRLEAMTRASDLVFSYGRFKCPGERVSKIELHKVLFEVFRRFEIAFVDTLRPVEWERNYALWVARGMWVRVEERGE